MRHLEGPALILALALAAAAPAIAAPRARPAPSPGALPPTRSPDLRPPVPAPAGKIYVMEILQTGELKPEVVQKLEPLHTLAEVEGLLKAERIPFAWRISEAATSALQPEMVRQIEALPPHEVFVVPGKGGYAMAVVLETRPAP